MPERFLAFALPQHEAAELYRLMAVGIGEVAVFLMDPNGIITVWNQAAQDMKGYTADEVIGQHLEMLYNDPDRESGQPARNLKLAAEQGVHTQETWRKRKDGSLFWAHVVLTALRNDDEALVGFSKITMDLTHHRKLEQCEREKGRNRPDPQSGRGRHLEMGCRSGHGGSVQAAARSAGLRR